VKWTARQAIVTLPEHLDVSMPPGQLPERPGFGVAPATGGADAMRWASPRQSPALPSRTSASRVSSGLMVKAAAIWLGVLSTQEAGAPNRDDSSQAQNRKIWRDVPTVPDSLDSTNIRSRTTIPRCGLSS